MRQTIDGAAFQKMILSAAASIEIHKQQINELNVFPVPDGDTGTNMSMTLNAAAADLRKAGSVTLTSRKPWRRPDSRQHFLHFWRRSHWWQISILLIRIRIMCFL